MGHQLYMNALTMPRPEVWQDRAACKGVDSSLFEIIDDEHPAGEGLTFNEKVSLTHENFAIAKELCLSCPVLAACWADADLEDRMYTYRAGRIPSLFSGRPRGRPKGMKVGVARISEKRCRRGHWQEPGHTGKCPGCWENRMAKQRSKRAQDRVDKERSKE